MPTGPRWLTWWKWGSSHKPKEKQEAEPGIQASLNHGTLSRGASLTKVGGARASGTKWSRRSFKKRPITIQEVNEIECQFEQECVHQGATIGRSRTDPLEPVFSHHNKVSSLSQRASGGLGEERRHPGGGRTSLSIKKVAPPTVPDPPSISHRLSGSSFGSGGSTSTDSSVFTSASAGSGSGSGSIGYCSAEQQDNRSSLGLDEAYYPPQGFLDMNKSEGFSGRSLPSPSHVSRAPIFSYPGSQHQNKLKGQLSPPGMMEDQGIDMTQSPGRESPSGSTGSSSTGGKTGESCRVLPLPGCRNSTTSLDSGRASADHRHPSTSSTCTSASSGPSLLLGPGPTYRLSGQSYDSMRHSYHSSSSSLGSGRIEDVHRLNAGELLAQGVPEHEVLNAWLTDLGLEDNYDLFVRAGYDMHTIIRMTPEDLTAIGVKKPNHRKQLKSEIALLNIPDGLPEFIPDTLEEWLSLLGLAEYSPSFRRQGYRTVEDVAQLTWEDLEDFGIVRLGHQKKITLAIKRVKDILSGKWVPPPPTNSIVQSQCYTQEVMITTHAPPSPSDIAPCPFPELSSFSRPSHYDVPRPLIHPSSTAPTRTLVRPLVSDPYSHYGHSRMLHPTHTYQPDVVAIQIHERPPQPTVFNTFTLRPRSYDDGDLVPKHTNSYPVQHTEQYHGGTLPRPKGTVKPRPVAKITAKTRLDNSSDPDHSDMGDCSTTHGEYEKQQLQQIPQQHYASFHAKLTMKPPPPPPPKRTQSIEDEAVKSNKVMDDPHPLPPPPDNLSVLSYSEDSEDFPPPPAPMSASELMQHGSSTTVAASVRERLDNILQRNGAQWPSKIYGSPAHFNPATHPNKNYPNWNSGQDNNCRERSPADSHDSEDNDNEFRQRRNGSDASFKSTSSTESESMPFANDNPGTIKQRINRPHPALSMISCNSPLQSPALSRKTPGSGWRPLEKPAASASSTTDVLSDIDNMLAGLTDELDAMLEEEKSAAASTAKK